MNKREHKQKDTVLGNQTLRLETAEGSVEVVSYVLAFSCWHHICMEVNKNANT